MKLESVVGKIDQLESFKLEIYFQVLVSVEYREVRKFFPTFQLLFFQLSFPTRSNNFDHAIVIVCKFIISWSLPSSQLCLLISFEMPLYWYLKRLIFDLKCIFDILVGISSLSIILNRLFLTYIHSEHPIKY